jgi:hypothetical protein
VPLSLEFCLGISLQVSEITSLYSFKITKKVSVDVGLLVCNTIYTKLWADFFWNNILPPEYTAVISRPENGDSMLFQNAGIFLQVHIVLWLKRLKLTSSPQ